MIGGSVVLRNPPVEYSSVIHQGVPLSGTSTSVTCFLNL